MAKQIVTIGNRVVAHGEDCFLTAGGTVICQNTGRTFVNATVTACSCDIPADIDSVGYEYHAGAFVPCAPYGKGMGNIAVVCNNDCKSIKDSGLPLSAFYNGGLPVPARIVHGTYRGAGKCGANNPNTLSFDFAPILLLVTTDGVDADTLVKGAGESRMILVNGITTQGVYSELGYNGSAQWIKAARTISWNGNTVMWYSPIAGNNGNGYSLQWNVNGVEYKYVAIG